VDIQSATALEQYVTQDSYSPAGAGQGTPATPARTAAPGGGARPEADGEQEAAETEPARPGSPLPAIYGSNARPVAARMVASSISLLA
jgi:hypothetical protein